MLYEKGCTQHKKKSVPAGTLFFRPPLVYLCLMNVPFCSSRIACCS
jgi:hypothetical protein